MWKGLRSAHAVVGPEVEQPYDLTQLRAVTATLDKIRKKYVEPDRVKPRQMFLGALDMIQKTVAQVIVSHAKNEKTVTVRVEEKEQKFRVDNVQGHWDVAARLREVFVFLQKNLKGKEVKLDQIEYAAANGILRTLDPHSVFLSPEAYEEMNVSTSGHFGGLGIVISMRDQMLTVMRPMPGTPAGRAGLKRLDRILKINNESTLNMPLSDAVDRLRGKPGSQVTIWIHRDGDEGWSGTRPFELNREIIRVSSVVSEKLGEGVGYVRIKQFQQTTTKELQAALRNLSAAKSLNGLVLDLREDPGGLLDQAGQVVDTFLEEGMIFATVGESEGRHEQQAKRQGTQPNYPIVVLVNEGSASASEIVTGALRNQDRAVVLGRTTFGKGSVQLVFPEVTPEKAALKLTIAQYLVPGDISIQGTGVMPDIMLEPMTADTLEMDLFVNESGMRERDLQKTLSAGGRRVQQPATYNLRYNLPESVRAEIRERGSTLDDVFVRDTPIQIAARLVSSMKPGKRSKQLAQLSGVLEELQEAELKEVAADLKDLGVDWSAPPQADFEGAQPKDISVKLWSDRPGDSVTAGEEMTLSVEVTNGSTQPLYQLRAITKSHAGYYDQRELVFGKVLPGETKTAQVALGWCQTEGRKPGSTKRVPLDAKRICRLPKDAVDRQDVVDVRFFAEGSEPPAAVSFRPTVVSLPRPVFAYSYHIADNRAANENGYLEKGEGASIFLRVKNVGTGRTYETQANLQNLTGDGLLLKKGRFDISGMKPGETRDVEFTLDVLKTLAADELKLEMSIADRDLAVFASEKLVVPVVSKRAAPAVAPASGNLKAKSRAPVFAQPDGASEPIGHIPQGAGVSARGTSGAFYSLTLGERRYGFVKKSDLVAGGAPGLQAETFVPVLSHSPPRLVVKTAALSTSAERVKIEIDALDDSGGVQDVFVFVGNTKVFYKPNSGPMKNRMKVSLDAPLSDGVNVITVVARENEDTSTRYRTVVRKDGPNGEALPTPKNEIFGEDWQFGAP